MKSIGPITLLIIIANFYVSYKGFSGHQFFNKYSFVVDDILGRKEYRRLVTSGFLHVGWMHLIFNMLSLSAFGIVLEDRVGVLNYLLIYSASLVGGNLFSLFIHRNHGDYSAIGASGAVCGVIFSCIVLFPDLHVGFFMIPASIPGWLYGFLYGLFSIYGIRSKRDNIGHEAHLGGAIVGLVAAIIIEPSSIVENYLSIALIVFPSAFFIYMIITKPHFLLVDNYFFKKHNFHTIDEKYSYQKKQKQEDVDRILDKIYTKGMSRLSKKEKEVLDRYAEESRL